MGGAERGPRAVQADPARHDFEKTGDLFGENTVAFEALAPRADIEFAAAQLAQTAEHAVFFSGCVRVEPVEKHILHRIGQAKNRVAGARGASRSRRFEDGGHFVVGEAGDDRRDVYAYGHAGFGEEADGAQPMLGTRGARLEFSRQISIEGGDGECDGGALPARELGQKVAVARNEKIFRNEADRIAELKKYLEALAHKAEVALGGLVAIGDSTGGDELRCPLRRGQFAAKQLGCPEFDENFGFEIKAAVPTEIIMVGPRVAISAAVL